MNPTAILLDEVSHAHGVDLRKLAREFDLRWAVEREQAAGVMFGPFHRELIFREARNPGRVREILRPMRDGEARGLVASAQEFYGNENRGWPDSNLRAAIATSTNETNLWNPAVQGSLPVGSIKAGRAWQLDFGGMMGATGTPTLEFRARVGTNNSIPPTGADLGAGPTVTLAASTNMPFIGSGIVGCRTLGTAASETVMNGSGFVVLPGAAAGASVVALFGGPVVATTVDSTVAQGLAVSAKWGTSSGSNTITPQWMLMGTRN